MPIEPRFSQVTRAQRATQANAYEGRWRWWYSSIADWMIRNPGGKLEDCARELNKHLNTISLIVKTDLFQDYLAQRKAEWTKDHDFAIRSKLTRVAELALDSAAEKLEKQRDKVDLPLLTDLLGTSLDRLGYAPKAGPVVQVNQQIGDNRTQVVQLPGSVSASALEEARMALRAAQAGFGSGNEILPPAKGRSGNDIRSFPASGAEPDLRELEQQLGLREGSEPEESVP